MSWTLLVGVVLILGLSLCLSLLRHAELRRMERSVQDRDRAARSGAAEAQLRHPVVDLSRCLGCGTCVKVCPEDGVLELVHGQAVVVNGARCVGHAACERECPVGAITVTIANLEQRDDIPALTEKLEAVGSDGLFLAGEVTAHALIKTAIDQGTGVAAEIARRYERGEVQRNGVLDLCVVGAGPAGLACSLEAKRRGMNFVTLDNEPTVGGTVAKYPRRKLVLLQPVDMPLFGRLPDTTYTKETLVALWQQIAREQEIPIQSGAVFTGLSRVEGGHYVVHTDAGDFAARHVCLAVGRRGVPRALGVPGEELPKVAYSLLDAQSYQGRRILVVGGGDNAVETAIGLAEQPGNEVTISYRKEAFFRIRSKNEQRLKSFVEGRRLRTILDSDVVAIGPQEVELEIRRDGRVDRRRLQNDEVFVMVGGVPPFDLLKSAGVSFDPAQRTVPPRVGEQGSGLPRALAIGFALALAALVFTLWNRDYYALPLSERPTHPKHSLLRPGLGLGLWFGVTAAALIAVNLAYLLRRNPRFKFTWGSLKTWMTSHIATGILALLCALLHGAMQPRDTTGGHAFWALVVLLGTGVVGRYFYAWVPRAANGRELELAEVRARLASVSEEQGGVERRFRERVKDEVLALLHERQWKSSFWTRVGALLWGERALKRLLNKVAHEGRAQGVPAEQVRETLALARKAHRIALSAAHFEDLRAVLHTWRYLHRWVAVLLVLLVLAHVVYALKYGGSI